MAAFQPADTLRSRTFIGLLIAQFLAAFNDQAIHASAMFFAINTRTLNEGAAITLMPILFYAPWAMFSMVAGYLADRYSKRDSLVLWKFVEIGITLVALAGFWLGTHNNAAGPWVVLSTVFLMGMHSAFFVPAKYGAMPEILQPHLLSRGNGVLESLSFLAIILGTVFGGVLSEAFHREEYWIGVVLVLLAIIGAAASLFIRRMPAANLERRFSPCSDQALWLTLIMLFRYSYQRLCANLRMLFRSQPLSFAVVGIAFFTFLVAFMRATVYMHGESQSPRWGESYTSIVVGMVALGIGIGSPLVGFLSGRKVEVGLVPIGAVGMIVATLTAAAFLGMIPPLIACIIAIGFFTGFYLVPLFTLLQHRAPKTSKGDSIATSNIINVTGAIAASLLLFLIIKLAHVTGFAPLLDQKDILTGELGRVHYHHTGHPHHLTVGATRIPMTEEDHDVEIDVLSYGLDKGKEVIASTYQLGRIKHYRLRLADTPQVPAHDNSSLPRLLFVGAGLMTLFTLVLLLRLLPDLFLRTFLWAHAQRRYRLEVAALDHMPGNGPLLLATNAADGEECLRILAATDRRTRFLVPAEAHAGGLLGWMARLGLGWLRAPGENDWKAIRTSSERSLSRGDVVALPMGVTAEREELEELLATLSEGAAVGILPVCHEAAPVNDASRRQRVYVFAGDVLPPGTSMDVVRQELERLGCNFRRRAEEGFGAEKAFSGMH
jgi:MFS family permease